MSKRKWQIRATPKAIDDFKGLPKDIKKRIRDGLRRYSDYDLPTTCAEHYGPNTPGWHGLRCGKYRIVFYLTRKFDVKRVEVECEYQGAMVLVAVIHRSDLTKVLAERY